MCTVHLTEGPRVSTKGGGAQSCSWRLTLCGMGPCMPSINDTLVEAVKTLILVVVVQGCGPIKRLCMCSRMFVVSTCNCTGLASSLLPRPQ
jgi:hypothetical protein